MATPTVSQPTAIPPTGFLPVDPAIETAVRALGEKLFALMDAHPTPGIFSKKGAYARLMEWSMKDPAFKTQLFRFVDVLPSLNSSAEIVRHLQEYLGDKAVELHPALKTGLAAASLAPALVANPVKAQVVDMARQFVAGEGPDDLVKQLRKNAGPASPPPSTCSAKPWSAKPRPTSFFSATSPCSTPSPPRSRRTPQPAFSDVGPAGPLPRLNLSVKISALTPDVHPADPENSIVALKQRLRPILRRAAEVGAFINFDMESYKLKDLTLALFKSILEEEEFRQQPPVGIALQAYLRDCEQDLRELVAWARRVNRPISVRLVKGAYWDYETVLARQRGWPVPVWSHKPESDANYEKLTAFLFDNIDVVTPAFASHNVRSCAHAIVQAGAPRHRSARLRIPGALRHGRRTQVGAAADGPPRPRVLRRRRAAARHGLLRAPPAREHVQRRFPPRPRTPAKPPRNSCSRNPVELLDRHRKPDDRIVAGKDQPDPVPPVFHNAANTDFTLATEPRPAAGRPHLRRRPARPALAPHHRRPENRRPRVRAVRESRAARADRRLLGQGDRRPTPRRRSPRRAPRSPRGGPPPPTTRAGILERAADLLESRRMELNALLILEAGKPWMEADADTSEAIDFCRFYASEMRRLGRPEVTQPTPGEHCVQRWTPRGVAVSIAPWNFPLAILTGLTVAPLVAGNAVIMKPARQTSIIGAVLMDVLTEAGVPPGALNYLPCFGAEVGGHLVAHPQVDAIAFTGSRAVGCKIWETAGRTPPGQANLKKVVCEMGGKNALIIDNDADLDEAIPAALYSAFGYSGQKCSALSRLIVLAGVYDRFLERFLAACPSMPGRRPGAARHRRRSGDRRRRAAEDPRLHRAGQKGGARWRGRPRLAPELAASGGYYVPPTVFTGVQARARHRPRGNLRAGRRRDEGAGSRRGVRARQRRGLRADRRPVLPQSRRPRTGAPRIPRRQSLPQPRHHGRHRRAASVRRFQDVGRRHQGRRHGSICRTSCSPAPWPRTRCDGDLLHLKKLSFDTNPPRRSSRPRSEGGFPRAIAENTLRRAPEGSPTAGGGVALTAKPPGCSIAHAFLPASQSSCVGRWSRREVSWKIRTEPDASTASATAGHSRPISSSRS